jgi:UDP-GlcNAc3NAcA epimerase
MRIATIIGARPQFVKAAIVSRAIAHSCKIEEILIHTGQHFDGNMSDVFFKEMSIPKPKYNLNINSLSHGAMTGQMLEKIEKILLKESPDCVLVYGDTNSTLAGALAAKKMHIKVAHIEAGLRSFNMKMPEEINRILTDRISDILFCPSFTAVKNLKKEGYNFFDSKIINVGDVMFDAAMFYEQIACKPKMLLPEVFVLCTIHRAENTDNVNRLISIFDTLEIISKTSPVLLPLHPRTKSKLKDINYNFVNSKIKFIDPVGYLEMVWLLKNCKFVMTDSGGLQKEAFFFKKQCITLRDETEWIELVELGFNVIAGSNSQNILSAVECLNSNYISFDVDLYGNGNAAKKIVCELLDN